MNFFESIKNGISNHFDRQKERRQEEEQLQREAELEAKQIFNQEFKKGALEVAKAKAYQDAAKKSGIQKLRALNKAKRLSEPGSPPGSFFAKLGDYTRKNMARREGNLSRTKMLREEAEKMKNESKEKRVGDREERMTNRRDFGNSTWKM